MIIARRIARSLYSLLFHHAQKRKELRAVLANRMSLRLLGPLSLSPCSPSSGRKLWSSSLKDCLDKGRVTEEGWSWAVLVDFVGYFVENALFLVLKLEGTVQQFSVGDVNKFFRAVEDKRSAFQGKCLLHIIILFANIPCCFSLKEGDNSANRRN